MAPRASLYEVKSAAFFPQPSPNSQVPRAWRQYVLTLARVWLRRAGGRLVNTALSPSPRASGRARLHGPSPAHARPKHCNRTANTKHTQAAMGGWLSYMWWGGAPDVVHPVSGLSRRDVHAVQRSWAPLYADSVATGTELLKRLFRKYPETKEFFRMVRKVPEDQYELNPQFKAHVINLMSSLNQAVANLNEPEVVAAMMHKLADSHKKRQIQERHFEELKDVIVTMFIEVLHMDQATLGSWARTVQFWYKCIFEVLNKSEGEDNR